MAPFPLGPRTIPAGLDIGTEYVRVAQVRPTPAGYLLTNYARTRIAYGAVVEGEIVDPAAVTAAVRDCMRAAGLKNKLVRTAVANQKVVVRLVDLPFMADDELAGAIHFQAQDYIPIPIEEAILSHSRVGEYVLPSDERMMEILLVAAQRDMINNTVVAVESAGLRLTQIDLTAFALARALIPVEAAVLPDGEEEAVGVLHVTSGLTTIVVQERGVPRFTRVSSAGGNQFTQAVANVMNITFDEAEALKSWVGLPNLDGQPEDTGALEPETVVLVQEALEREANKFIAEVRRSLDYYLTQTSQAKKVGRLVLAGNAAHLRNLIDYLKQGLQTDVVVGDGLDRVELSKQVEEEIAADRFGAAVAIGLAIGEGE